MAFDRWLKFNKIIKVEDNPFESEIVTNFVLPKDLDASAYTKIFEYIEQQYIRGFNDGVKHNQNNVKAVLGIKRDS